MANIKLTCTIWKEPWPMAVNTEAIAYYHQRVPARMGDPLPAGCELFMVNSPDGINVLETFDEITALIEKARRPIP